jgi:hypothetical protein
VRSRSELPINDWHDKNIQAAGFYPPDRAGFIDPEWLIAARRLGNAFLHEYVGEGEVHSAWINSV